MQGYYAPAPPPSQGYYAPAPTAPPPPPTNYSCVDNFNIIRPGCSIDAPAQQRTIDNAAGTLVVHSHSIAIYTPNWVKISETGVQPGNRARRFEMTNQGRLVLWGTNGVLWDSGRDFGSDVHATLMRMPHRIAGFWYPALVIRRNKTNEVLYKTEPTTDAHY